MIKVTDLQDWIAQDESDTGGCWTVRERYQGLNSEQPPLLLIATGTEENMRMIAATIALTRLLVNFIGSPEPNVIYFKTKARAILTAAGVEI